jgi:hypothetical protein
MKYQNTVYSYQNMLLVVEDRRIILKFTRKQYPCMQNIETPQKLVFLIIFCDNFVKNNYFWSLKIIFQTF